VGLRLPPELQRDLDALEPDLAVGASAIGLAVQAELARRRPALARAESGTGDPDATLVSLDLDREGAPDAVSLAACLAAHSRYVASRGHAEGVSLGALALARLLVWSARAAMLGPAPRLVWIGPPARRPELGAGQVALGATAVATIGGTTRRAGALAVVAPPGAD
jgi:hypothetical protein